jgi:DNA-binding HxlR family transcriptional regulator
MVGSSSAPWGRSPGRDLRPPPRTTRAGCPIADLFAMLGQPHMLDLLSALLASSGRPLRFTEIQNRLGLSPKTLTHRLKTLGEAGIVARRAYSEIPPRVEYEITAKGREFSQVFQILGDWARRNTLNPVPDFDPSQRPMMSGSVILK